MKHELQWTEIEGVFIAIGISYGYSRYQMANTHLWGIKITNPDGTFIKDTNGMSEEMAIKTLNSHYSETCRIRDEALENGRAAIHEHYVEESGNIYQMIPNKAKPQSWK